MEGNPYGLESLWLQGDIVIRSVAVLLLLLSVASWYVIVTKTMQILRYRRASIVAGRQFWDASNVQEGVDGLGNNNPFADLAKAGVEAMHHHSAHQGHLHDQLSVSDWVTLSLRQSIDESSGKLQAGMAVLASVGSTAPFVGLFGTVWGIYHALVSIGTSGQAGIDKVAGPVGEALIMTALGLAVAIPATFGYNALVRGNKTTLARLNKFGFDLHALFVTGSRSGTGTGTGTQPEGKRLTVARSA
nr:MotA/TolQ/ExbB proton channel family protein [uncultured Noviherbaspirillum sp.]